MKDLSESQDVCMKMGMILCLVVVGLISSCLAQSDEEWKELNNQIFAKVDADMEALQPARTLELLERLDEALASIEETKKLEKSAKVQLLISQNDISVQKCTLESLKQLVNLLGSEASLVNIAPYLESLRPKYYAQCHGPLLKALNNQVAKLSVDQRKYIKSLKEAFLKYGSEDEMGSLSNLKQTIADLANQTKSPVGKRVESVLREEAYKAVAVCTSSNKLVGQTAETYAYLIEFLKGSGDKADPIGLQWVTNYKICAQIIDNERYLK